jgi:hypothetical protein
MPVASEKVKESAGARVASTKSVKARKMRESSGSSSTAAGDQGVAGEWPEEANGVGEGGQTEFVGADAGGDGSDAVEDAGDHDATADAGIDHAEEAAATTDDDGGEPLKPPKKKASKKRKHGSTTTRGDGGEPLKPPRKKASKKGKHRSTADLGDEGDGDLGGWRPREGSNKGSEGRSKFSGWPGDDDIESEVDGSRNEGDIFSTSAALLAEIVGGGSKAAVLSSLEGHIGREAVAGNVFVILQEAPALMRSAAPDRPLLCFYQVAPIPADPAGVRRAYRVATSMPDYMVGEENPQGVMAAWEVTLIDFQPDTVLSFVSAQGWIQALKLSGSYLRFSLPHMAPVIPKMESPVTTRILQSESLGTTGVKVIGATSVAVPSFRRGSSLGSLSSVPGPTEVKKEFGGIAKHMFRLAPSVIAQAEAVAKESGSKSTFFDRASRRRDEIVLGGKTLVKLGASSTLLDIISVAAVEIYVMPLATVFASYHQRLACPINMVVMSEFVGSWKLGDSGRCLAAFANLHRRHGERKAVWRGRDYSCLMEVDKHSDAYLRNFGGEDGKIFGADVAIAEEATFNLLLLIFMLTGMRFGLQAAMIRAVERTFVYIRANDFGVGSAHSPILIRTVLVELFIQLDALRSQLLLFRCPADEAAAKSLRAELVAELDCLPNLAAGSETYLIVERLRLAERDNQIEFLMGLNAIAVVSSAGVVSVGASGSSGAVDSGAGGGGKGKGRKKRDKSLSGAAGSPSVAQRAAGPPAAAQVSAVVSVPVVGQQGASGRPAAGAGNAAAGAGSPPAAAAGRLAVLYCNQFLASSGCRFAANSGGRACRFVHQIPARASPDYAVMAARLLAMGVTPSVDFTSAV